MPVDEDAAGRRIMNQFGEESRIPILNIREGDVWILLGVPILALFVAGLTGMKSLAIPLVTTGLGFGIVIVYVTPSHLSAWEWTRNLWRFLRRPRITYGAPRDAGEGVTERNAGGLANYTPFTPDERTQDLTNVKRAWPGASAIQRTDDAMEAFIEVYPGNMDFAMSGDWAALQRAGEEFANKELDCKLKLHATTRAFPIEEIVSTLEARLRDEDVTDNPIFRALLEEYLETRPEEMRTRGTQEVRYFIGVEVSPIEIYSRYRDERTPAEKLTSFPVVGFLFRPFVTRRENLSEPELRTKLFEKLDARIATVRNEFVQTATGWSDRRLSTVELFALNLDYWNGEAHEFGAVEHVVRDHPIVGHSQREDELRV